MPTWAPAACRAAATAFLCAARVPEAATPGAATASAPLAPPRDACDAFVAACDLRRAPGLDGALVGPDCGALGGLGWAAAGRAPRAGAGGANVTLAGVAAAAAVAAPRNASAADFAPACGYGMAVVARPSRPGINFVAGSACAWTCPPPVYPKRLRPAGGAVSFHAAAVTIVLLLLLVMTVWWYMNYLLIPERREEVWPWAFWYAVNLPYLSTFGAKLWYPLYVSMAGLTMDEALCFDDTAPLVAADGGPCAAWPAAVAGAGCFDVASSAARARSRTSVHASRALRATIGRPAIGRDERRPAEIGARDVGSPVRAQVRGHVRVPPVLVRVPRRRPGRRRRRTARPRRRFATLLFCVDFRMRFIHARPSHEIVRVILYYGYPPCVLLVTVVFVWPFFANGSAGYANSLWNYGDVDSCGGRQWEDDRGALLVDVAYITVCLLVLITEELRRNVGLYRSIKRVRARAALDRRRGASRPRVGDRARDAADAARVGARRRRASTAGGRAAPRAGPRPPRRRALAHRARIAPRRAARNSNLRPDFNVRAIERFGPDAFALLRELDESDRFVQKSAESTSMWPSERMSKFGRDVPAHRLISAQAPRADASSSSSKRCSPSSSWASDGTSSPC